MEINRINRRKKIFSKLVRTYGGGENNSYKKAPSQRRKCPVDGTGLLSMYIEEVVLDYCPECSGIWFDRGELHKVLAKDVKREELTGNKSVDVTQDRAEKYCPDDNCLLIKRQKNNSPQIDVCPVCAGIWLDGGEFAELYYCSLDSGGDRVLKGIIEFVIYA